MQFPVPQFTDVEDKIIGGLTIKQFGILFGVGVIIFLSYSASKSLLVAAFFFVLFGLPALGLAFVPFNGRPIYNSFGVFTKYFTAPKELIFHKEAPGLSSSTELKNADLETKAEISKTVAATDPRARLKEVNALLKKQAEEERELAGKIR